MALGTMPTRPALLVKVIDTNGCFGWGEVWANFPPRANIHKAHIIEDVVAPKLKEARFVEPQEIGEMLRDKLSTYFLHIGQKEVFEHILAGIDTALWDLALRDKGQSFADFMRLETASAQTYATSINADDLETLIPHHTSLGQKHFKLKIGFAEHGCGHIMKRAKALCDEGSHLMVDSNQAWTLKQAIENLQAIEVFSPSFAEEPLRADAPLNQWEALSRATNIPLAGGENIYGVDHFLEMTNAGVKFLQPDVAKWGGISGVLQLAKVIPDTVKVWPHFMGTAIGQMASLALSAAIGEKSFCEVDVNANTLRTELCGDVLNIVDGRIALPKGAGLVMPPEAAALNQFSDEYA